MGKEKTPSVPSRRTMKPAGENRMEVRQIVESTGKSDFGDRKISVQQFLRRILKFQIQNILSRRRAVIFPHGPADMFPTPPRQLKKAFHSTGKIFGQTHLLKQFFQPRRFEIDIRRKMPQKGCHYLKDQRGSLHSCRIQIIMVLKFQEPFSPLGKLLERFFR